MFAVSEWAKVTMVINYVPKQYIADTGADTGFRKGGGPGNC